MDPYGLLPRAIAIAARTAHLLAMAGYLGGRLTGSSARSDRWRNVTTVTGAVLLATEASHSRRWAIEGRGLLVFAHIGILPIGHLTGRLRSPVAIAALMIGAVGSHLPRSIRKWSLLDRRLVHDQPRRGRQTGGARDRAACGYPERHDDPRSTAQMESEPPSLRSCGGPMGSPE